MKGEKGESRETAGPRVRDDICLVVWTDRSDGPLRNSADGNDSTITRQKLEHGIMPSVDRDTGSSCTPGGSAAAVAMLRKSLALVSQNNDLCSLGM